MFSKLVKERVSPIKNTIRSQGSQIPQRLSQAHIFLCSVVKGPSALWTTWHLLRGSRLARAAPSGLWLNVRGSAQWEWTCKALRQAEVQLLPTWGLYWDFKVALAPGLSRICVCVCVCVCGQMRLRNKYVMRATLIQDSPQHH